MMKKTIYSFVWLLVSCVLLSCGVQVQLQTLEPSAVNLRRGTQLRVVRHTRHPAAARLQDALYEQLADSGFFSLGGNSAILGIEHVRRHTHRYINHTCKKGERCRCTESVYTDLEATVQVELGGSILYYKTHSDTSYSHHADYGAVAASIVKDLVPRAVWYSERVNPADGNEVLEAAAKACAAGDWQSGHVLAERSLQLYPQDAEAYYLLGLIERNNRNFRDSDAFFRQAYTIRPEAKYTNAIYRNADLEQNEAAARAQLE